jgi:hypothetical protein
MVVRWLYPDLAFRGHHLRLYSLDSHQSSKEVIEAADHGEELRPIVLNQKHSGAEMDSDHEMLRGVRYAKRFELLLSRLNYKGPESELEKHRYKK